MFRICSANGLKKLIKADSFQEFVDLGSEKLQINKENVRLYLSDGCEIEDYGALQFAYDERSFIYFIQPGEQLPGSSLSATLCDASHSSLETEDTAGRTGDSSSATQQSTKTAAKIER